MIYYPPKKKIPVMRTKILLHESRLTMFLMGQDWEQKVRLFLQQRSLIKNLKGLLTTQIVAQETENQRTFTNIQINENHILLRVIMLLIQPFRVRSFTNIPCLAYYLLHPALRTISFSFAIAFMWCTMLGISSLNIISLFWCW